MFRVRRKSIVEIGFSRQPIDIDLLARLGFPELIVISHKVYARLKTLIFVCFDNFYIFMLKIIRIRLRR